MAELAATTLAVDANLKAYYKAENVNDTTANAFTLTNNGSTPFNAAKYNNGFDFGANNAAKWMSRTDVSNTLGMDGASNVSVSLWVKLQTEIAAGAYTLWRINFNDAADRYFELQYQYNAGTPRLQLDASGAAANYTITLGTSNWNHIVLLYRPAGTCELWVNNVQRATVTGSTGSGGAVRTTGIGATPSGSNKSSALIDDVGVFNKILSSAEISLLFTDTLVASSRAYFL